MAILNEKDQLLDENYLVCNNNYNKPLRVLIFNESFYPYTSGISRRFIEIIKRLAKKNYKIHLVTGTNVSFVYKFFFFFFI